MQKIVSKNGVLIVASGLAVFFALAIPRLVHAQSSLQQTTSQTGLQPQSAQSSQAQATANTQNQVGSLQQNKGEDVLSQSSSHALGVVSSPNQTQPDVVVQPSTTLSTAPVNKKETSRKSPVVLVICLIILIASVAYWAGQRYIAASQPVHPGNTITVHTSTEASAPSKPKHKKKRSRKKRTPHQH